MSSRIESDAARARYLMHLPEILYPIPIFVDSAQGHHPADCTPRKRLCSWSMSESANTEVLALFEYALRRRIRR